MERGEGARATDQGMIKVGAQEVMIPSVGSSVAAGQATNAHSTMWYYNYNFRSLLDMQFCFEFVGLAQVRDISNLHSALEWFTVEWLAELSV